MEDLSRYTVSELSKRQLLVLAQELNDINLPIIERVVCFLSKHHGISITITTTGLQLRNKWLDEIISFTTKLIIPLQTNDTENDINDLDFEDVFRVIEFTTITYNHKKCANYGITLTW